MLNQRQKKVNKPNQKKFKFSKSEIFKSLKFINLILQISKSKNTKKIYNQYIKKLISLIR